MGLDMYLNAKLYIGNSIDKYANKWRQKCLEK